MAKEWELSRNLLSKDLSDFNLQISMYGGLSPLLWISRKNFQLFTHINQAIHILFSLIICISSTEFRLKNKLDFSY